MAAAVERRVSRATAADGLMGVLRELASIGVHVVDAAPEAESENEASRSVVVTRSGAVRDERVSANGSLYRWRGGGPRNQLSQNFATEDGEGEGVEGGRSSTSEDRQQRPRIASCGVLLSKTPQRGPGRLQLSNSDRAREMHSRC